MSEWNSNYYKFSSISQAAYAHFTSYDRSRVETDLQEQKKGDFTAKQAEMFVQQSDGYTLIQCDKGDASIFKAHRRLLCQGRQEYWCQIARTI